jgi:hypothetical protein
MSDIILRFSGGGLGIPGRVIQWATWSWCSHVEFEIPWNPPEKRLLGAMPGTGVAYRSEPRGTDREPRVERYLIEGAESLGEQIQRIAETQLGAPYDWAGVLGYGFHRDWEEEGDWFCSEFCPWAIKGVGIHMIRTDDMWRICPRDLLLSVRLKEI